MSSSSSSVSGPIDPLGSNTTSRAQFLLLGETSPVLASAKIYIAEEPIDVRDILVSLTAETPTVPSLLVYDDDKRLLGRANLDPSASTNRTYKLTLAANAFAVQQREERTVYVRAEVKARDNGGQTNQLVQVSAIVFKANGVWSTNPYTTVSPSAAFPIFRTARSTITSITNAGPATDTIFAGYRTLGSFAFTGRKTDPTAHIDITDLTFDIGQTGGVTLSNVVLGADGLPERFPCIANALQITCSGIPDTYGSITDGPRTLTLYGTVAITDANHASMRLTLNETGSATTAGSVTWSDGTSSYTWVALPGPLAEGTMYSY